MDQTLARVVGIILVFAVSATSEPLLAQDAAPPPAEAPAVQNSTQPPIELPDSPGSSASAATATSSAQSTNAAQNSQPSGTAAAPSVQVSGSAASKPAGVAIAPPKQRQIRSWLIKFGFLAGAGVAIGTVAALSAASPGRVPNSGR